MATLVGARAAVAPSSAGAERVKSAGLGQIVISSDPDEVLVAYGLGSCVAVAGYDPLAKVAGLLHALLPQHRNGEPNHAKFVDTGIPRLVQEMESGGARRRNITWYVVGGAEMLRMPGMSGEFNIGSKNADMARVVMERENLRIKAIDVGGTAGRTVKITPRIGVVTVRTLGRGEIQL